MVRIRLTRIGRKKRPYWRIAAFDQRTARDGAPIEYLGTYDPMQEKDEDKVSLTKERVEHWLSCGAQPTETVAGILKKQGFQL